MIISEITSLKIYVFIGKVMVINMESLLLLITYCCLLTTKVNNTDSILK